MDTVASVSVPTQLTVESLDALVDDLQDRCDLHDSNEQDDESVNSAYSEMAPFEVYKPRVEKLLLGTDLVGFTISVLQHGYKWQNCVYALTSPKNPEEKYVLRVPVLPEIDDDGKCEEIEKDAALLGFLAGKLPVPSVKTYCSTKDNVLEKPYTVQTRLPGVSLNNVYGDLKYEEKVGIIDQFVELLAEIESINFATAGTFSKSGDLPPTDSIMDPPIAFFEEADEIFVENPEGDDTFIKNSSVASDRKGSDLKLLLVSLINGWIQKEYSKDKSHTLIHLRNLLTMLNLLDDEGVFKPTPSPIVLHHCDLEPRNIMVENIAGVWKIQGVIDWDAALALPRPLTRRAPNWIWDFDSEGDTGYLDNDHHPKADADLTAGHLALKKYFDAKAAEKLDGYLEDAYGQGKWLRRIWTFARDGGDSVWYIELMEKLKADWIVREVQKVGVSGETVAEKESVEVEPVVVEASMTTTIVWGVADWLTRLNRRFLGRS